MASYRSKVLKDQEIINNYLSKNPDAKLLLRHHDMFQDCLEFTKLYQEKTGNVQKGINTEFITRMVQDELQELREAKDQAEQCDALVDIIYYCLQHLTLTDLDIRPLWKMVHQANLTKFRGDGHKDLKTLKWIKPSDFKPPDDDLRDEIRHQVEHQIEKIRLKIDHKLKIDNKLDKRDSL